MSTENVEVFNRYYGNGAATQFSIGFPYLKREFVKVYLYKKDTDEEKVLNSDQFSFVNDTTIQYPVLSTDEILKEGDIITIQRETELGSEFEFDNQRRLFPVEVMNADDLAFQQIQELSREIKRAVRVNPTAAESPEELLQTVYDKLDSATEIAGDAISAANQAQTAADNATAAVNSAEQTLANVTAYVDSAKVEIDNTKNTAINTINSTVAQAKTDINSAIDEATMNISDTVDTGISSITEVKDSAINTINTSVSTAESNISTIVSDAEGSITNIAVTEANKAIANAAQEATDTATANLNSYVDGTVKPSLQTYVDQAQANANSAATSMEQAALSATSASNYASNASADADNAAESAGLAANSAAAAATSETNAKASETNALIWAEGTDAQVQALGGEKSAKGWAEASTAVNYTNITNCITEIPQDIKLELNNGVLTLKAGSKVYVPNGKNTDGSNKFDEVVVSGDINFTYTYTPSTNIQCMLFINNAGTKFVHSRTVITCYSGTTQPSGSYINWYNTTENKMYSIANNATVDGSGFSFPIAIITQGSDSVTKSIDQVFNGFGYIGKRNFITNAKLLIAKGYNADGTYHNQEYVIDSPIVSSNDFGNNSIMFFRCNTGRYQIYNISKQNYLGELSSVPAVTSGVFQWYYNTTYRMWYMHEASETVWRQVDYANIGENTASETKFKTAFHAVDYNDYIREINKKGGGLEIGDIGFAPLGIDETQNKRRYLNGQVISQTQFATFANKVKAAIALYPSLSTTETNWQAEVTNSKLGQCGKFVIDDTAGTIRLPKVVNINGLTDLSLMGGIKAESLPNITGTFRGRNAYNGDASINESVVTGAFGTRNESGTKSGAQASGTNSFTWTFDASRSSSTYQDGAPVQQEAVQYPYFIQVATGSEESVDVSTEIQLNNPFFFGMHIWSDTAISNASWLISNGSYHSGATYVDFYEWLLKIHNGTMTVDGVSVKAYGASGITDYDYVINTTDTIFRLPVKVKLASGNAVAGNGMTLGLTNGSSLEGLGFSGDGIVIHRSGNYGVNVGLANSDSGSTTKSAGITTDPTKSGIETSSSGLKLYFYVGETVQDANVIAASNALTDIADLKAHSIVETYVNGTSWYRVYSDGWCEQGGYSTSSNVIITLLKTYANTNYTITLGKAFNSETNTRFPNIVSTTKTTAQFKVTGTFNNTTGTDCYFYWETKGYIA